MGKKYGMEKLDLEIGTQRHQKSQLGLILVIDFVSNLSCSWIYLACFSFPVNVDKLCDSLPVTTTINTPPPTSTTPNGVCNPNKAVLRVPSSSTGTDNWGHLISGSDYKTQIFHKALCIFENMRRVF